MNSRRVIVTQAEGTGRIASLFRERGVDVWEIPTIRIVPPERWDELDGALRSVDRYDWIVVTSRNAAAAIIERAHAAGVNVAHARYAAVGDATADTLRAEGCDVEVIPPEGTGVGLGEMLVAREDLAGKRVLFPCSDIARQTVPERLRAAGATVDEVVAYRTVPAAVDVTAVRKEVESDRVGAITFASPSAAKSFAASCTPGGLRATLGAVPVASIGPTTSDALRELGCEPDIEAATANADALVVAVMERIEENG